MKNFNKSQIIKRKRTLSRLVAVQVMYQFEFFNKKRNIDDVINNVIDNYVLLDDDKIKSYRKNIDIELIESIIDSAINNEESIKEVIEKSSKNEETDRLTKQILKLAICEILFFDEIDQKVSINEYCDIAGLFFDDSKVSFISYTLNQITKK